MDAVVIAGGIPEPDDLLYPYTQGQPKALLEVAGKPMVQWVLDALSGAGQVGRVVLIGIDESYGLTCEKPITFHPNQGGMLENIIYGIERLLEQDATIKHALMVSSDIPGIKPEIVDWVVSNALQTDDDLYYHLITQEVMDARYPSSKRTYTHLRDVVVCGGDMNVVAVRTINSSRGTWEQLIGARKNPLKQAAIIGFDTLLQLALRVLTVEGAVKKIARRMNMTGRAVLCPYAEVGMDVDKPHQLELIRADLGGK
jgi:molybdopterin-guanine dinucleotide biosynthesis protein A